MRPPPFSRSPAALAAAVVLLVVAAAFLVVRSGADDGDPDPAPGAVLDGSDRLALDAAPVRRGPPPPPVDPAVDLADPAAVARAYLAAARGAGADDRGHTHLQATGYAAPGSPPAAVGVLVLDPPPPGQVRTAAVTALDLISADDGDQRRGYRATVATATGPPPAAGSSGGIARAVVTAYVVLARQPDGRWLVTTDTSEVPEGDD